MAKRKNNKQEYKIKPVTAKTDNQKYFIQCIENYQVTICKGIAGSGKSHIAIGMAINALRKREVQRIIISRPVVEAGESLGFLPGDIDDKMAPYIRPVLDELLHFISYSELEELRNSNKLEICPLAYMRGRNFHNCFVVSDESQNISKKQLKMLLSRLGMGSKMVVVGDTAQSDLVGSNDFEYVFNALSNNPHVATCCLYDEDIIRNPIVSSILKDIENHENPLTDGSSVVY